MQSDAAAAEQEDLDTDAKLWPNKVTIVVNYCSLLRAVLCHEREVTTGDMDTGRAAAAGLWPDTFF